MTLNCSKKSTPFSSHAIFRTFFFSSNSVATAFRRTVGQFYMYCYLTTHREHFPWNHSYLKITVLPILSYMIIMILFLLNLVKRLQHIFFYIYSVGFMIIYRCDITFLRERERERGWGMVHRPPSSQLGRREDPKANTECGVTYALRTTRDIVAVAKDVPGAPFVATTTLRRRLGDELPRLVTSLRRFLPPSWKSSTPQLWASYKFEDSER